MQNNLCDASLQRGIKTREKLELDRNNYMVIVNLVADLIIIFCYNRPEFLKLFSGHKRVETVLRKFLTTREAAWYIIAVVLVSVCLSVCLSDGNFRKF